MELHEKRGLVAVRVEYGSQSQLSSDYVCIFGFHRRVTLADCVTQPELLGP